MDYVNKYTRVDFKNKRLFFIEQTRIKNDASCLVLGWVTAAELFCFTG